MPRRDGGDAGRQIDQKALIIFNLQRVGDYSSVCVVVVVVFVCVCVCVGDLEFTQVVNGDGFS